MRSGTGALGHGWAIVLVWTTRTAIARTAARPSRIAAIEFAIVATLFVVSLLSILDVGLTGFYQAVLDDAVRDAARQVQMAASASSSASQFVACNGNGGPGPAITSTIGGYVSGTRGAVANTGCSAINTVVPGVTCGFLVTVTASATIIPAFSGFLGGAQTVTATATKPFLNPGSALAVQLNPNHAASADSIWVYPYSSTRMEPGLRQRSRCPAAADPLHGSARSGQLPA